jgi:uncharacterized protein
VKFTREMKSATMIRSVSDDAIVVGDKRYVTTIALTAEAVIDNWQKIPIAELRETDFGMLLDVRPEVIVLGTGPTNLFPPRELVFAMARRGVGLEVMDTAAAARTFNVLCGEGRQVAAILYL